MKGYSRGLEGGRWHTTKGGGQGEELVNEKRSGRMSHGVGGRGGVEGEGLRLGVALLNASYT